MISSSNDTLKKAKKIKASLFNIDSGSSYDNIGRLNEQ